MTLTVIFNDAYGEWWIVNADDPEIGPFGTFDTFREATEALKDFAPSKLDD